MRSYKNKMVVITEHTVCEPSYKILFLNGSRAESCHQSLCRNIEAHHWQDPVLKVISLVIVFTPVFTSYSSHYPLQLRLTLLLRLQLLY